MTGRSEQPFAVERRAVPLGIEIEAKDGHLVNILKGDSRLRAWSELMAPATHLEPGLLGSQGADLPFAPFRDVIVRSGLG